MGRGKIILFTIKERLISYYFSLFPKYTNPVKWRDFFLCNSSESLVLKAILHSLHTYFVSDFAAVSFLKEGILIFPNLQFLVLKVDLTLLIKILFKFYFDSKWSNRRSPSLGSRSRPHLKYFQELGIAVIIIPSSTKINDHFLKMPQALFKYNAFFIFYHESFGIVWTLATFNPNRFEPTRKVSSSLISCYYQPLTLGLEARFDIKSAMRDFSKNVLFRK